MNYTLELIIGIEKNETLNYDNMYKLLSKFFNVDGFHNLLTEFYNKNPDDFMKLLKILLKNHKELLDLFEIVDENLKEIEPELLDLAFNLIKNVNSNVNMTRIFVNFFKNHRDMFDIFKIVLGKPEMKFAFNYLFKPDSTIIREVIIFK